MIDPIETPKTAYEEMLRAPDKATMYAAFERFGLVRRNDEDELIAVPGVHISGRIHISKVEPVYDGETLITPGEPDARYHCDILVTAPVDMDNAAHVFGLWEANGTPGTANKGETSLNYYGVELIDRASVNTPAHMFAR